MSRKLSATEIKISLANLAKLPPDDVDGYVVVYVKGADVLTIMTNADSEASVISVLARAIEHRARAVKTIEDREALEH